MVIRISIGDTIASLIEMITAICSLANSAVTILIKITTFPCCIAAVCEAEGVFIGSGIEIKRSAKEMPGRIGKEELLGGGGIASDLEVNTADPIGGQHDRVVDRAGLIGMLEGHLIGVAAQLVKLVRSYFLVADIDAGAEAGEVYIDPVRILGDRIEIAAVPDDRGVDWIIERIGKSRFIEGLVLVGRKVYLEVSSSFGGIDAVAGKTKKDQGEKN